MTDQPTPAELTTVHARFYVHEIRRGNTPYAGVTLRPVVKAKPLPGHDGNVEWSKFTPSGEVTLNTLAEGAGAWFEQMRAGGHDIAIEFTRAVD
jgi:hypothetical protein